MDNSRIMMLLTRKDWSIVGKEEVFDKEQGGDMGMDIDAA